jgi:membrane-bound ClpP family serine protease
MSSTLLLILGLLLIFLEFFLPGAILGTIGAILWIASLYVAATNAETTLEIFLFVTIAIILLAGTIVLAIWWIPRAKGGRSIYLRGDQEGYIASTFDKTKVGKEGVAVTDLRPGGYIEVEGEELVAISKSGYIEKGAKVSVVGGEGESLQVILK